MDMNKNKNNVAALSEEMKWLAKVIDTRTKLYWDQDCDYSDIDQVQPPSLDEDSSLYADTIRKYKLGFEERIVISLALAPHMMPQLLDVFFTKNPNYERSFTEFGGVEKRGNAGFLPTGETAAFILAANDLDRRVEVYKLLGKEGALRKNRIIYLESVENNDPFLSGALKMSAKYLSFLIAGTSGQLAYDTNFPAKHITTPLDWPDLVLDNLVLQELQQIRTWVEHRNVLQEDQVLGKRLKPGYRCLFYGATGTGKTLAAYLLGKVTGLDVYKVNLLQIVSYNNVDGNKALANIFDQAEQNDWILLFTGVDSLFHSDTITGIGNDRQINQQAAYLLQRIEDYPGLIILTSNLRTYIDDAFTRRFQSIILFPMPSKEERYLLWKNAFSEHGRLGQDVDLKAIADSYEISGGAIINVMRYVTLKALQSGHKQLRESDIIEGINRELRKENKTFVINN